MTVTNPTPPPAPLTGAAWIAPTLLNSWVLNGSPGVSDVGYLKDPLGFVHLRGRIKAGASATTAFVLPAGYRPGNSGDTMAAAALNSLTPVPAAVIVASGNVNVYFASTITDLGFGGISFLAEN